MNSRAKQGRAGVLVGQSIHSLWEDAPEVGMGSQRFSSPISHRLGEGMLAWWGATEEQAPR